ncbi:TIGR04086 family membrane protein [Paenibacillus sediminis]|uniref:Membrane protein (TIGR04086 family) n=1 Tax=Paenibacillus sediminis TaxID=664909 RepID=A0ABS4GY00_9BACL|nr:TIGR04086 family membrane protein [Paenibacillus sediminis]MBP1935153.1 putative membrane protein (TIGR04086 family) [Paenibacillus sediminis]
MQFIRRQNPIRISNPTLAGLWYAFVWMIVGALCLSLLLWLSSFEEQKLSAYTYVIHSISSFIGGFVSGKRSGNKGWLQGGLTGLLYGLCVILIGFLALDTSLSLSNVFMLSIAFSLGAFGGIFGVNVRK